MNHELIRSNLCHWDFFKNWLSHIHRRPAEKKTARRFQSIYIFTTLKAVLNAYFQTFFIHKEINFEHGQEGCASKAIQRNHKTSISLQ